MRSQNAYSENGTDQFIHLRLWRSGRCRNIQYPAAMQGISVEYSNSQVHFAPSVQLPTQPTTPHNPQPTHVVIKPLLGVPCVWCSCGTMGEVQKHQGVGSCREVAAVTVA